MVCDSLPDDPDAIGQLDGDTAVSRNTFKAALAAAGAVCTAVDEVMSGAVSLPEPVPADAHLQGFPWNQKAATPAEGYLQGVPMASSSPCV